MRLLEREPFLEELTRRRDLALAGKGQTLFVCGEAGVGKSALLTAFLAANPGDVVLRGYCDDLATPHALGPVSEIAAQLTGEPADGEVARDRLFADVFSRLRRSSELTQIVIEDLHWADEATFDFIRYLARRIAQLCCLLLITYRDDETGALHPLGRAIGDLTGDHVSRMRLASLSKAAVAQLSTLAGRDGERVFSITSGNPFFVRELLSAPAGSVPMSVRDSMLARLARCSAAAKEVSEYVALAPGRMELDLVALLVDPSQQTIDETIERGILTHERGALAYRHELARRAVEDSLPPAAAQERHAGILAALLRRGGDVGRIVHHARAARDQGAVMQHAPQAAKRAAAVGSHREAAAYYAAALEFADRLEPPTRGVLLERHAYECYLTNQIDSAIEAAQRALAIWRELGDRRAQGRTLRFLSRQRWFLGHREIAERHALDAIALHESFPPDRDLAMAYSNHSQLAMLAGHVREAVQFGEQAIEIAHSLGDIETECHALNNVGTAKLTVDDESGRAQLERSLSLALAHDLHEHVARAYVNLATSITKPEHVASSRTYFRDGSAYADERDLYSWTTYLQSVQSRFELARGNWECAAQLAATVLGNSGSIAVTRIPALVTLALARMRRGEPEVDPLLEEALQLALPTAELRRIGWVASARAEHAWHRGNPQGVTQAVDLALQFAAEHHDSWILGKLLFWKSRVVAIVAPQNIASPYRKAALGEWREAADEFERFRMPYEQALLLLEGDRDALMRAQTLIERLGATALRGRLEAALQTNGRKSKWTHPNGLTNREIDVLRLLGHGYTNAELARKLFVSAKTVDHHVSAILGKLAVRSRAHAVTAAYELGIVRKTESDASC